MTLVTCPGCSRQISTSAAACPGCGRAVQVYLPTPPPRSDEVMEGLRAYVGPSWDSHYRYAFGQLLYAERKGRGAGWTWNWSAALVPCCAWFLYRRLFGAAAFLWLAALVAWLLHVLVVVRVTVFSGLVYWLLVIGFCVAQGFLGDRLLYARARGAVGDGTSVSREELARRGRPMLWMVWTAAVPSALILAVFVVFPAVRSSIDRGRAELAERTAVRTDGWVWFRSRPGDFKVAFPHDPAHSTSREGREHRYTAEYRNGAMLQVSFEDDGGAWLGADEFRLPEAPAGGPVEIRAELIRPQGRYPGFAATYELGEGTDALVVHHRVYRAGVGGRLYQVIAMMKKSDPAPEDVERFFSSFEIFSKE